MAHHHAIENENGWQRQHNLTFQALLEAQVAVNEFRYVNNCVHSHILSYVSPVSDQ